MGRQQTEQTKQKLRKKAIQWWIDNPPKKHQYMCIKCKINFERTKKIHKNSPIHCDNCKRKVVYVKNVSTVESILDFSSRTVGKILKRANVGCSICGWHDATCDIHHIVRRCDGGKDDSSNLIIACPNHHRDIHFNPEKYTLDYLQSKSIEKTFPNWKQFYNKR